MFSRLENLLPRLTPALVAAAGLAVLGTQPAAAEIAQRGTATTSNVGQNSTSISIGKPSGVGEGDVMIAVVTRNANEASASIGAPSGWSEIHQVLIRDPGNANKIWGATFYKVATAGEGSGYSFNLNGSTSSSGSNGASGAIVAFSGVDVTGGIKADGTPGGPFDVDPGTINVAPAGNAVTAPGIATATANAAVLMLGMVGGSSQTWANWATSSPGSLAEIAEVTRAGSSAAAAWAIKSSAGATGNGTASVSLTAQPPGAILVALKEFAPLGPTINAFTVTPAAIDAGQSAMLAWDVSNADTVSIDNGLGTVAASGSTNVSPAATTTYTLTATNVDGTRTATATVAVMTPGPYRYYRFVPVALRTPSEGMVQISEFQMLMDGVRVAGATAGNPGGSNPGGEGPAQANDNNVDTKWLDFNIKPLVLDFGASTDVNGYRWATANDSEGRDPVGWRVEGSHDGANWKTLDTQTGQSVPSTRKVYLADFSFESFTGPTISSFAASPVTLFLGEATSSTLSWTVTNADPGGVSIDNGIGTVNPGGSTIVSPPLTTSYTLTATGGGVTRSKTVAVRRVPVGSLRFFRFVPVATRSPGSGVHLAEFQILLDGVRVAGAVANNPGGLSSGNEGPTQANDNDLGTKWLDYTPMFSGFTPLELDFGDLIAFDGYRWATAGDTDGNDPVSWRIEGSADGATWRVLDVRTNFAVPTDRKVYLAGMSLAPNTPPTFAGLSIGTPFETAAAISLGKVLAAAADADGDALSVTAAGPASAQGGTAVLQAGAILYTPPAAFSGSDSFPVIISDARGANVQGTVTVVVQSNTAADANPPVVTVLPDNKIGLSFQGIPGRTYEVQRSTNLIDWSVIGSVVAEPNGAVGFTDPAPPPGDAYYRMRRP